MAKAEKKEADCQVAQEANAAIKKAATTTTKTAKAAKPLQVVILQVGSTILNSLGSGD
jgi:hypothetical protein